MVFSGGGKGDNSFALYSIQWGRYSVFVDLVRYKVVDNSSTPTRYLDDTSYAMDVGMDTYTLLTDIDDRQLNCLIECVDLNLR